MAGIQRLLGQVIYISTKNSVSFLGGRTSVLPTLKPSLCQSEFYRFSSTFLSRVTADQLWKGVTSVSSAGRKKGRGRGAGRKLSKDLNRGQVIGFGSKNMLWPGLNAPVIRGKEVVVQQELPPDESRQKRIIEMRDKMVGRKSFKVHPLERGWCGNKLPGRSIGPPDPDGDETFEGFDSRVVQFRVVMSMSAKQGRVRNMTSMVVVGNKKGLVADDEENDKAEDPVIDCKYVEASGNTTVTQKILRLRTQHGYGYASSPNGQAAAKRAKNRAAQALRHVKLYEDHTVLHDFHSSFGAVIINVKKMPQGYGLVCHRVIKAICEMVGIKDLHAKVYGPAKNTHCLVKAFFIGLMRQQTHQELADKMGLHLIEQRSERDLFPRVLASPEKVRSEKEIGAHEPTDYESVVHNCKVFEPVKKFKPFYLEFDSYKKKLRDTERFRNHEEVKRHLIVKYGKLASFLTIREEEKEKQAVKDIVEET